MNITLYVSNAEKNRMYKDSFLGENYEFTNCTLKVPTSFINPVIILYETNYISRNQYNYAYIPEFKRYYFVTDIICTSKNMWEIHMHVDVLMSWKEKIVTNKARVMRNEYRGDEYIFDELADLSMNYNIIKDAFGSPVTFQSEIFDSADSRESCCCVVTVTDNNTWEEGFNINTEKQKNLIPSAPNASISTSNETNVDYIITTMDDCRSIVEAIRNNSQLASYVQDISVYPFSFLDRTTSVTDAKNIGLSKGTIIINGVEIQNTVGFTITPNYICKKTVTFQLYAALKNNYLKYSPYTKVYIQLPIYGLYELDLNRWLSLSSADFSHDYLEITFIVDAVTKDLMIIVGCRYYDEQNDEFLNIPCDIISTKIGASLIYNVDTTDVVNRNKTSDAIKLVGNILSSLSAPVTGALGGMPFGPAGMITGAAAGTAQMGSQILNSTANYIANRVKDVPYGTFIKSNLDTYLSFYYSSNYVSVFIASKDFIQERNDDYKKLCGIPCDIIDILSNFNGYTVVSDIHLENVPALSDELDEITQLLQQGILMPDN